MSSSIPKGKMDVELYEKRKQVVIDFINKLHDKTFLKMIVTSEEDALIDKVRNRVNSTGSSVNKLEEIITSDKYEEFQQCLDKFGILQSDTMNIYGELFVHQILETYELLKKYLMVVLKKDELELSGKEPLGSLLCKLEKKEIKHRFDECMDKEIRNVIGHGWYWFENNKFYYIVDPSLKKIKSLSLAELFIKMREVSLFLAAFLDNAFQRVLELKNQK
jgi:hypothetical protein